MQSTAINMKQLLSNFTDESVTDDSVLLSPQGFREYDARWWYGFSGSDRVPEINLAGLKAVGAGLAHLLRQRGNDRAIIVGHDLRSYSFEVKTALVKGLVSGGAHVCDIGLALSPMAYYAQFALNIQSVAMVTASHNENGWTGVKMGCERPYTFGPEDMAELKVVVLEKQAVPATGGQYNFVNNIEKLYASALIKGRFLKRRLKIVVVCGNGTAGLFAPQILRRIGCEVIEVDCTPNWNFPKYNPDPEAAPMQKAMTEAVQLFRADMAFGFDGDGDRCGVADHEGNIIYADRIGLLLAQAFSTQHRDAHFIVDVKSSGLFRTDPVLQANNATVDYWKTGHSYIKRRMGETHALAGFEKSGHVFLNQPLGLGYDDGLATAIAVCEMLAAHPDQTLASLNRQLPQSFATPTLNIPCCDQEKYRIISRIQSYFSELVSAGGVFAGQSIRELLTINGARVTVADGTWGLIRASSNKPDLVVVAESPVSLERRNAMLHAIHDVLARFEAGQLSDFEGTV